MPFKKGVCTNPTGKNGLTPGFTSWKIRVQQLLNKYKTIEAMQALVQGPDWRKTNPIDAGIIAQIVNQFAGDDKRLEREAFWDRMEGKPKESKTVRVIGSMDDLSEEELAALAQDTD